ncbi:hypothetical protein RAMLITH_23150 [Ramlibacter sp. RBP-2]|uniref:O-antigen ligase domain-containing protein n=1 Tax=Ramlibacter lithotrophicus TaxID=2606681 RepID=A0A7X6I8S0_9BURK|nr:hypothetical protein [Ramlibacter lithotrophicus]NKE68723.1 hypothetical protein [Ramlibacter lithotrophicus]
MRTTLFGLFAVFLALNGLASVSILGIPLPWLGLAGTVAVASRFLAGPRRLYEGLYFPVSLLLAWALVINLFNWPEFGRNLPLKANTSYAAYVILRYLTVFSFVASAVIVVRLCRAGHQQRVIQLVVKLGTLVAAYAIYVYLAQLYGLPEVLPRSRMGTGGGEQSTTFTYAFHRAIGSFREPSHLAEWLMVPFVLSFAHNPKQFEPHKLLMGASILLTGSMTGIMSLLIGLGVSYVAIFLRPHRPRCSTKMVGRAFGGLALGLLLVYGVDLALSGLLLDTVEFRTKEIWSGGMIESNRNYVYEYLAETAFPFAGSGLGNANIEFSTATGNDLIASFLSLYLNTLYSLGFFGFGALVFLLGYPLYHVFRINARSHGPSLFVLVWAYAAWLIAFGVHSEELTTMFAIAYALLFFKLFPKTAMQQVAIAPATGGTAS